MNIEVVNKPSTTLHKLSASEDSPTHIEQNLENDVVQEILKTGADLRQYSKQIEKELKDVENRSIQDYIKESQSIANLHGQISACDSILARMESMLMGFQTDLGSISTEILSLQRKSISMNQELSNRQSIRGHLSQFIDDMAVPEPLIVGIMDTPVTQPDFLAHLQSLNHKLGFVKEQSFKEARSCADVKDVLEKLKIKAMSKIRAYLLEQVLKFRKPMTNYQVPQNTMLKHKFFYEFILSNERNVAQEILHEYVDTMSKIYFSYFKSYSGRIMKLQYEECATKDDLMGIEDTASRGLFHKASLRHKGTVFTIGSRGDVLAQQLEAPIIVPHAQLKNRYHFEALFRSEQYALVDNACREFLFVSEFFMVKDNAAQNLFNQILGKTITHLQKSLETFVADCYDTIALFLCFHLILRYQLMCHKRCVPALDMYWESLQNIILPRLEVIFRLNIASIRDCDASKFQREMGPHYISRRYAEFSAALVGISEQFPNELVNRLLSELQQEVESFVLRMAGGFTQRRDQLIYLINNYDMMLTIVMERTRDTSQEAQAFRGQLGLRSAEYVEEILSPHFGEMIQYVKDCERFLESDQVEQLKTYEVNASAIVQHFGRTWKKSLEELNREVLLSFPNLVTGSSLLQLALTQLVQYYHRFHKLLSPQVRTQLTNIHHIIVEMKKYKTSY